MEVSSHFHSLGISLGFLVHHQPLWLRKQIEKVLGSWATDRSVRTLQKEYRDLFLLNLIEARLWGFTLSHFRWNTTFCLAKIRNRGETISCAAALDLWDAYLWDPHVSETYVSQVPHIKYLMEIERVKLLNPTCLLV